MNNEFTTSISALKGMVLLAGKKDIRYYLNGVKIEFNENITRLIACDGHKLGLINLDQNLENAGAGELIIPRDVIENLKPVSKGADTVQVKQISATHWEINNYGTKITFSGVEGKYPDYARVMAFKTSGESSQFNPEFLMAFYKAAVLLTGSKNPQLNLSQNGQSSALIRVNGLASFAGVVMPYKGDTGAQQSGQMIDAQQYAPLTNAPALSVVEKAA